MVDRGPQLWHRVVAVGLVREPAPMPFTPWEARRVVGEIESGRVSAQRGLIDAPDGSETLDGRRIRLDLHSPTRDGENTGYLLTTIPAVAVDACTLTRRYRERWTLEQAFLHLTRQLRCEIDPLAYPPAARFGLAMAVVAYNGLAVVKATLRQVHGAAAIDDGVSGYDLVHKMARVTESLETLVEPRDGVVFQTLPLATMAAWRIATTGRVQLRKYRKHPRGPKKPPAKRAHDPRRPHVSVARRLAQRQSAKEAATP